MDILGILRDRQKITRAVFAIIAIFILLALINIAYNYFSKGGVNIFAPENSEIYEITSADGYSEKLLSKSRYSARYLPGVYTFIVKDGDKSTVQSVKVERSKNKDLNIELKPIIKPEKIFDITATDLQANDSYVNYVNNSYNFLERYTYKDSSYSNYPIPIYNQNINELIWSGPSRGLMVYNSSLLAFIDGSSFTPIKITNLNDGALVDADINTNNQIVATLGNSIYLKKDLNENGIEVANNLNGQFSGVSISNKYYAYNSILSVALAEELTPEAQKIDDNLDRNIYYASIDDPYSKSVIESKSDVSSVLFSPDSNKVIFTNESGINLFDINNKTSEVIYSKQIPKPDLSSWIDNERFVFIDLEGIWIMNINTKTAFKVGSSEEIIFVKDLTIEQGNKSKLYYSTFKPREDGSFGEIYSKSLN